MRDVALGLPAEAIAAAKQQRKQQRKRARSEQKNGKALKRLRSLGREPTRSELRAEKKRRREQREEAPAHEADEFGTQESRTDNTPYERKLLKRLRRELGRDATIPELRREKKRRRKARRAKEEVEAISSERVPQQASSSEEEAADAEEAAMGAGADSASESGAGRRGSGAPLIPRRTFWRELEAEVHAAFGRRDLGRRTRGSIRCHRIAVAWHSIASHRIA